MNKEIIQKYINGSLSKKESNQVENWILASEENTKNFNLYKASLIGLSLNSQIHSTTISNGFQSFKHKQKKKKQLFYLKQLSKYSAIVVLLLSVGSYFFNKTSTNNSIPKDAIVLQLENGKIQLISENKKNKETIFDNKGKIIAKQQGKKLIYNNKLQQKSTYNTLLVPYGKKFYLSLADGTQVYLNSGTKIKYPTAFVEGKKREIYLTGEASFNVAKDSLHPFVVNTNHMNIGVLGTEFIVSSYPEDQETNTILLEGSVKVFDTNEKFETKKSTTIIPGQKATLKNNSKQIKVENVDVTIYTAWTNGKIVFRHMSFDKILKKLERHYNVTFINNNKSITNEYFTASFDVETIDQVMELFHKNYGIKYIIKDKIITIN